MRTYLDACGLSAEEIGTLSILNRLDRLEAKFPTTERDDLQQRAARVESDALVALRALYGPLAGEIKSA